MKIPTFRIPLITSIIEGINEDKLLKEEAAREEAIWIEEKVAELRRINPDADIIYKGERFH